MLTNNQQELASLLVKMVNVAYGLSVMNSMQSEVI